MSAQDIRLNDAQDCLKQAIAELRTQRRPDDDLLVTILEHISRYISVTRTEIASLRSSDRSEDPFSTSSDELQEVVAEAAKATNEIMSATETIERLDSIADDRAAILTDAVTRIYVACAFQDITGQRIAKVIRILRDIEMKIASLARACGAEVAQRAVDVQATEARPGPLLCNGPQLAGDARSQQDIDNLFDSAT